MQNQTDKFPQLCPLWISVFVDILGFTIILPFLPVLAEIYTTNSLVLGLLLASNAIFGFFFSIILGKLSDKFGRKPLLLISQAGTTLGFLIMAFSTSIEMLFIARIIDGIFGGQFPISKAVISDVVPPQKRGKQMTNIGVAFTSAAIIGPALGGILSGQFGIIGPGLLASAISIITFIFTAISLPETLPTKIKNPPQWIDIFKEKMKTMNQSGPTSSIWRNSKAVYILIIYAFMAFAAVIFRNSFSLFSTYKLSLETWEIGLLFSAMGVFQVIFRYTLFNRIRDKLGDTITSIVGLGNYIISYLLLVFAVDFTSLMFILFYISLGGTLSRGILTSFASRVVDFKNQGKMMGLTTSIDNLSQIFGPIIGLSLLIDSEGLILSLVLSLISAVAFLMSIRLRKFGFEKQIDTTHIK